MLSPKDSLGICIPSGVSTFLHAAFTAHGLDGPREMGSLDARRNARARRTWTVLPRVIPRVYAVCPWRLKPFSQQR